MSTRHPRRHHGLGSLAAGGVFGAIAFLALVVGHELSRQHLSFDALRAAGWGCAALVLIFGVLSTRSTAGGLSHAASTRAGTARATPLRLLLQVIGYSITLLGVLVTLNIDVTQFLAGGAVTGVVIGIAAQQALGNFFAGIVLQTARPYVAGDRITVYAGSVNGPHQGVVEDITLLYTTLATASGPLRLPNSVMLAAGVAPAAAPASASPPADDPSDVT